MTTCLNQFLINNEIITKSSKLKSSSKNIKGIHTSNLSICTDYISTCTISRYIQFLFV